MLLTLVSSQQLTLAQCQYKKPHHLHFKTHLLSFLHQQHLSLVVEAVPLIVGMIQSLWPLIISFSNPQPLNLQVRINNSCFRPHFPQSNLNCQKSLNVNNLLRVFQLPTFRALLNKISQEPQKDLNNNHQIQNSNNKYFRNALDTQAAQLNISVSLAMWVSASSACLRTTTVTGQPRWRKPFN